MRKPPGWAKAFFLAGVARSFADQTATRQSHVSSSTAILSPSMASAIKTTSAPSVAGATTALVLLTALNFVNYIDRYILPGVQEQIKAEFHLSDEHIGTLTFWFMIAYMLTSPVTGWLGD